MAEGFGAIIQDKGRISDMSQIMEIQESNLLTPIMPFLPISIELGTFYGSFVKNMAEGVGAIIQDKRKICPKLWKSGKQTSSSLSHH